MYSNPQKLISRKILSGSKIHEFPHCAAFLNSKVLLSHVINTDLGNRWWDIGQERLCYKSLQKLRRRAELQIEEFFCKLTHLLKMAKSFGELNILGKMAAFPGTRITPMYFDEFLGEISRLISSNGDPLTLSNSNKSFVSSSAVEDAEGSNTPEIVDEGLRYSEKLPWMNSTAEKSTIWVFSIH